MRRSKKNIFVTGGSGFIGTHLVTSLLSLGFSVTIYDKVISTEYPDLSIKGDIRDRKGLTESLAGHDIVIHLAAEHQDNLDQKSLYYDVNVKGTENLVYASTANEIVRIIFTSTAAVYPLRAKSPSEATKTEPFNDYGKSKLEAEFVLTDWGAIAGNSTLILRPSAVVGRGNKGNMANLIRQIKRNRFFMVGDGTNKKSLCCVENLVHFIISQFDVAKNDLYNFVDKPDLSMHELVSIIRAQYGLVPNFVQRQHIPYFIGIIFGHFFDALGYMTATQFPVTSMRIRKFTSETTISGDKLSSGGFAPKVCLSEGISSMMDATEVA